MCSFFRDPSFNDRNSEKYANERNKHNQQRDISAMPAPPKFLPAKRIPHVRSIPNLFK
jgi:hypothetical protein